MLNRAARFFPILQQLKDHLPNGGSLLEVGSGALGLGEFWRGSFVGCDLVFSSRPVSHMHAVVCAGHQLPFNDRAFDAVVISDVMEHVLPEQRKQCLTDALRLARKVVICGYPCGPAAFALDKKLYRRYQNRNLRPPAWLEEHMLHAFPDESLFAGLAEGWSETIIPNESLKFHDWMMTAEMSRFSNRLFRLALRIAPRFVEHLLDRENCEPSYRKIFVLTRDSNVVYA